MTGRYTLTCSNTAFYNTFHCSDAVQIAPRVNICPNEQVPVILGAESRLMFLEWGFPVYHKEGDVGMRSYYNRTTTQVRESKRFWYLAQKQRCLFPASGFILWRDIRGSKQPYYFYHPKNQLLAFAGLWDNPQNPKNPFDGRCIMLVTQAPETNLLFPLIITAENYDKWLTAKRMRDLTPFIEASATLQLNAHAISKQINNPSNNDINLLKPLSQSAQLQPS